MARIANEVRDAEYAKIGIVKVKAKTTKVGVVSKIKINKNKKKI
mgnify:CR=1 FL=1